ncbi:MAG TPA: branched-chain amino acid ABC transporter permease [Dehalococcoidales bacterium]|nr:branched-chain amino acid ABC transporter permease [Dehalococcoidales bacterium]
MERLILQSTADGLIMGLLVALVALGLTIQYSIMHLLNFAHGDIYMLGGFAAYYLITKAGINYFLTLPIVMVILFVFGMILERAIFRPVRGSTFIRALIATTGLSFVIQAAGWQIFGTLDRTVPSPISGTISLGLITLPVQRLVASGICIVLVVLLYWLVNKTKIGRQMRAIEQDAEASSLFGVNVTLVNIVCIGIGCALAGVAGQMVGSIFYINPSVGTSQVINCFNVIIIGGLGSITGCIVAALLLGVIQSIAGAFLGISFAYIIVFAMLLLILIVRPRGLMGHE